MNPYTDMLTLSPPLSHHKKMPPYERAAQFAPFAALSGFEERISEQARLTDRRPAVCDEDAAIINDNLNLLLHAGKPTAVRLTLFVPDTRKEGGAVIEKQGEVRRVDTVAREVIFTDKTVVPIDDILTLAIL